MSWDNRLVVFLVCLAWQYKAVLPHSCKPHQVERRLPSWEIRCCNPNHCRINEEPVPCKDEGENDECKPCEHGLVNPYSVHTRGLQQGKKYCKTPGEYCNKDIPPEARRVNLEECMITGFLIVECDRTSGYTGTDILDCYLATVNCTGINTELTLQNTCRRCKKGYHKPRPGKGICIKDSSLSVRSEDIRDVSMTPSTTVTTHAAGSDTDKADESVYGGPSTAVIVTIISLLVIFLVVLYFVVCTIYTTCSRANIKIFFAKCTCRQRSAISASCTQSFDPESQPSNHEGDAENNPSPAAESPVQQNGFQEKKEAEEASEQNSSPAIEDDPTQPLNHPPANKESQDFLEKHKFPKENSKFSYDATAGAAFMPPWSDVSQNPPSSQPNTGSQNMDPPPRSHRSAVRDSGLGAAFMPPWSDVSQNPPSSQPNSSQNMDPPPRSHRSAVRDSGLGTVSGNNSSDGSIRLTARVSPFSEVEHESLNLTSAQSLNPNSILSSRSNSDSEEYNVDGTVSMETYLKVPVGQGVHPQDQCSLDITEATETDPFV